MPFRLLPDEPAAAGVRRVAAEEVEQAAGRLRADGGHPTDEGVHEARKSLKKVRAVLRLVRHQLGPAYPAENAAYRDAGRALSAARDAAVLLAAYDGLAEDLADALPLDAFVRVRRLLGADLDAARRAAGGGVAGAVAVDLTAARDRIEAWPLEGEGWAALAPGVVAAHRGARRAMRRAAGDPTDEHLHEWRKRVKDTWYHLRLLEGAWPAVLGPTAEEAHRLSDLLGDDHDLAVLEGTLLAHPDEAGPAEELRPLFDVVAERRARLRADAFDLGRRLYADKAERHGRRLAAWWAAWHGAG